MSEILEKYVEGDQQSGQTGLHFFSEMSPEEKAETEHLAGVILELTEGGSFAEMDEASEISSQFPRLIDIPDNTSEALGLMIRDCDSISNPSELPHAIAELVSLCQQRNSRSLETETVMRRLEDLTETMLTMQQQHYAALSASSPPLSLEISASESSQSLREQASQRYDPPANLHPASVSSKKKEFAPDPPENDSFRRLSSKCEESGDPPDQKIAPLEKEGPEVKTLDPRVMKADNKQKRTGTEGNTANARAQNNSNFPDDTLVQTIVAEVLKKLQDGESSMNSTSRQPPSSEPPKRQHLPDEAAMQIVVRDAKEKLAASEGTRRSSVSNPNDWIVERLRPPSSANTTHEEKEEETADNKNETEKLDSSLRIRMPDDPPDANQDSNMADRKPKPVPVTANLKRAPIDPPESKQKIPTAATVAGSKMDGLEEGADSVAGAYRFRAPTSTTRELSETGQEATNSLAQPERQTNDEQAVNEDPESPEHTGHDEEREITARVVDPTTDRDGTIQELTAAVQSLQEQLALRDQEIPRAEVVETGCQCVIL